MGKYLALISWSSNSISNLCWEQLLRAELYLGLLPSTLPQSHSSNLLIGLLLSIGIPVIGYFTLVRLELAESKGQATSLSGSSKLVVHQL